MATPNPLPFQYSARWSMFASQFDVDLRRILEDRDRQLEDYLGKSSVVGSEVPYTPSLIGTGWSRGAVASDAVGFYSNLGRMVLFFAVIVLGTDALFGAGTAHITLPPVEPSDRMDGQTNQVEVALNDVAGGAGTHMGRGVIRTATSSVELRRLTVVGTSLVSSVGVNNLNPFTWAPGDSMSVAGWYASKIPGT